jgi:deazaflavin-dependent oxidoreductase (nitroreductase family)
MTDTNPPHAYVQPDLSLIGQEHVRRYLETDGAVGHEWNGATCLILTTRGRKSGEPRSVPLIYGRDGDDYIVIASKGGAPEHPSWYENLLAEPRVHVQVRCDRFDAIARTIHGVGRDRLWSVMTSLWPNYDQYAKRTTRKIPLIVLKRHGPASP